MSSCLPILSSHALLHITLFTLCFLGLADSRPTQNVTLQVPYGTTDHGDPDSLCIPPTWIDIASFFLFNYIAHGATVVSYPGERAYSSFIDVVIAILFPTTGVKKALDLIFRHPRLTSKNDLELAARSGALCMLIRTRSWKPQKGDDIRDAMIDDPHKIFSRRGRENGRSDPSAKMSRPTASLEMYLPPWLNDAARFWSFSDTSTLRIGSRVVFGFSKRCKPPDQYEFVFVPRNTEVLSLVDNTTESRVSTRKLSSSFNLVKGIAALVQLFYTSFTLYHTNGGQLKQYGFAAPGLTVLPYAVMSGLNLIANLVTPHYPTMYLVRSKVMEEAERRTGSRFNYVVGELVDEAGTNDDAWSEIAGYFKHDNKVLYVAPSAKRQKKRIEISDYSSQTIYFPACPRFQRTDDTRNMGRRSRILSNIYEMGLVTFIVAAENIIILILSNFSGQQSTLVQRAWIVTWLLSGYVYGVMAYLWSHIWHYGTTRRLDFSKLSSWVKTWIIFYIPSILFIPSMVCLCAPAIGGFVVVSQMLQAYGICYKFV